MFFVITETGRSSGTLMKNTRVAGLAEIWSKQKIALLISNSNLPSCKHCKGCVAGGKMRVTIRYLNNYELILAQQFKQLNIVVHSDPAQGPKDLNELML